MQLGYLKMAFERISRMFKEIRMPPLTRHSLQEVDFWVLIEVKSVRILRVKVVTHVHALSNFFAEGIFCVCFFVKVTILTTKRTYKTSFKMM